MSEAPVNSSDSGSEAARGIDRRRFLKSAAAASSLLLLPRHLAAGDGAAAPSEKLNIAGIGVGGMGKLNLRNLSSQNIVALCDVDLHYAAPTIAETPGGENLDGLPRDVGETEGHRCGCDRHTGPHPCGDRDGRDPRRQTILPIIRGFVVVGGISTTA